MKPFTHLHVHSHYSLLSALPKIKELVSAAKEDGMTSLALTDNNNMYGTIEFYIECEKNDIKPIIGIDAYVAPRTRHDKETRVDSRRTRLVLLAENDIGYKNLIKIVTASQIEGFYYKPRIDRELIEKYHEGLICISPFFAGDIATYLDNYDIEKAHEMTSFLKGVFGGKLYLELLHHPELDNNLEKKKRTIEYSKEHDIPLLAAHDVYYLKKEDRVARKTLISIQSSFGARDNNYTENEDFSFISQKTANEYFKDTPEALENTEKVAEMCNVHIPIAKWKFPDYKVESGRTPDEELRHMTMEGLERRKMELNDVVKERIDYELGVIEDKGYANYFLTVSDLLNYARDNDILTNTRGSAAGSLVSYLTGITTVDPILLQLPFERFLNPGRPSAPDVDMDFADARRDEVIEYARSKYGHNNVAQIGTFGTMAAKGAVRDVTRAMGYDYEIGDGIAKLIPLGAQGFPMTIQKALDDIEELRDLYNNDSTTKEILDMAQKIEGCARHIGVHAAGVVISPDPLEVDVPVQLDPKGSGKLITQYNMHSVGEDGVGLLKFDFLGLKNLTIIGNVRKLAKKLYDIDIVIDDIPLDDKITYEMISRGETGATFQLNGDGMIKYLKDLKPTNIDDINAMVALYRPGPLAFIPDYIERKNNPSKVRYIDDRFKEILEMTYGILIYQDDIMLLAVNFAGYSWGEADKFRKAMGKKIPELMAQQKEKFYKGCQEVGGLTLEQTKELWEQIETFAAYGFNKGHAASYGLVAYWTSYLKANFPVMYMAAVLTSDQGDVEKIRDMINECKKINIEVLPPDINESFEDFTVIKSGSDEVKDKIRFGLKTIKNFGDNSAKAIITSRKKDGPFISFEDFLNRISSKDMNKKSLEALAKCGALDKLIDRGEVIYNLEDILTYNKEISKQAGAQDSLFGSFDESEGLAPLNLKSHKKIDGDEKLKWEKEHLGLYISGNPLDKYKSMFETRTRDNKKIKEMGQIEIDKTREKLLRDEELKVEIVEEEEETEVLDAEAREELKKKKQTEWRDRKKNVKTLAVLGIITSVKVIMTKKGEEMAFVEVTDYSGPIEVVIFPKTYAEDKAGSKFIQEDNCVRIDGELSLRNDEVSILGNIIKPLVNISR